VARCRWLTPVVLATQEAEIRRITVQNQSIQKFVRPYLEKNHHKSRAGGVTQMVEFLPSKLEALSSNPSTRKKKKNYLYFFTFMFYVYPLLFSVGF
jgi:hypothetical protein